MEVLSFQLSKLYNLIEISLLCEHTETLTNKLLKWLQKVIIYRLKQRIKNSVVATSW